MVELGRQTIFKGAKFSFENISVRTPRGETIERQVVRHPGSVVILPILESAGEPIRVVMIRNDRIAPGRELIELPAGTMEPPEPPDQCAMRELEEETGYSAQRVSHLTSFYTTPGMTDEYMHAYAAHGLRAVGQHTEADESIVVAPMTVREVIEKMDRGEICDGKTLLVVQWALRVGVLG